MLAVHGTGLVLGDRGVLLRGRSGAGKSLLALALLDRWEVLRLPAMLVADDRIELIHEIHGLSMRAPARMAGQIELRDRGIVARPHREIAVLHLLVDLVPDRMRLRDPSEMIAELAGVTLARAPVPQAGLVELGHQVLLVVEALRALDPP